MSSQPDFLTMMLKNFIFYSLLVFASSAVAQDNDDDLPVVPVPKHGYQCVDWQGHRRERTEPCSATNEKEFRGYDSVDDAKKDIKSILDGRTKLKSKETSEEPNATPSAKKSLVEETSPEEKKRLRMAWLKFIGVALVFGIIAKLRKASALRWSIVGVFIYGTLILGNFISL